MMMMKIAAAFLALALSAKACIEHGTLECPACSVDITSRKVIAGFDFDDYYSSAGYMLVSLVPATEGFEGIDFVAGQMAGYDAEVFEIVEDVPVDWNNLDVAIVLEDIETEEIFLSSVFTVGA